LPFKAPENHNRPRQTRQLGQFGEPEGNSPQIYPLPSSFSPERGGDNTKVHRSVPMRPLAHSDGHDVPGLIDELVPCEAAVVDDVVVGFEDAVRQPVVAHELPYVLNRVELRASWRQRHQGNIGRHDQFGRTVPSGLIEQEDRMRARRDVEGDFLEVHAHRLAVATGHDDTGGLAFGGTDRAEQPCRGATLVLRR